MRDEEKRAIEQIVRFLYEEVYAPLTAIIRKAAELGERAEERM